MLEGELPKCCVLVRVQLGVLAGVLVSSAVAQPYIIVGISEDETGCFVLLVDEPGIRGIQQPMLQKHRLKSLFNYGCFLLDSEDSQNIAILSDNLMGL